MDLEAIQNWYFPLRYVIPAYALAILLIAGYARSIAARSSALERERAAFDEVDTPSAESASDDN